MGLTNRFGARYGRRPKTKFSQIEELQRTKYKCPYCSKKGVKRLSLGIWECRKCKVKFAARAYTLSSAKTEAIGK
ncbi:50S ribosomal protein L37ae [Candidatus Woesearchaeota archaeon]|nr:50S ribosomal protein L37ae [Candidatus Woesearchaeota archaeon]